MTLPSTDTFADQIQPDTEAKDERRVQQILSEIALCKQYRRKQIQNWSINIDYRRGKPFASQADEDRISVNKDWPLTKQKHAQLFSQVPQARVNHPPQTTAPWVHTFESRLNDVARTAGIEAALEEVMPDCINASGIGIAMVSREAITEEVEVPAQDLAIYPLDVRNQIMSEGMLPDGTPLEMVKVPRDVDSRYIISRISPSDFIWSVNFVGSDFNKAPLIGRSGRITWAEAIKRFKLDPAQKSKYISSQSTTEKLSDDLEKDKSITEEVQFDEIFYHEYQYDSRAKSFSTIHHMVFVAGNDKPVIDEPWKGQEIDKNTGKIVGSSKYPIQVLTLTYITDDAIPPSDTSIGRSQVDELIKSRTQQMQQREYSKPLRWFNVSRLDPSVATNLMRGQWQAMIPVQGQGDAVIGEIQRSQYPPENALFDRVAKADLNEIWQVGVTQAAIDIDTAEEASDIADDMRTRVGHERAKVGRFFCGLMEVLGGLLCIYEDPESFGEGFSPTVSAALGYSILADSTVLLDTEQRIKKLVRFLNYTAKSGSVDVEPVIREIATLSGLDPNVVIKKPEPKSPVEPNISLRLTGTEDLLNPLVLAFLLNSGQAPPLELIQKAKDMIQAAVTPPPVAGPLGPQPPLGPDGKPIDPTAAQAVVPPPEPQPLLAPEVPIPQPPPPAIGDAHPEMSAMPRINQRVLDTGNGGTQ